MGCWDAAAGKDGMLRRCCWQLGRFLPTLPSTLQPDRSPARLQPEHRNHCAPLPPRSFLLQHPSSPPPPSSFPPPWILPSKASRIIWIPAALSCQEPGGREGAARSLGGSWDERRTTYIFSIFSSELRAPINKAGNLTQRRPPPRYPTLGASGGGSRWCTRFITSFSLEGGWWWRGGGGISGRD